MPDGHETALSPEQAVDRLEALHAEAVRSQREALARFAAGGAPPDPAVRRHFRYTENPLVPHAGDFDPTPLGSQRPAGLGPLEWLCHGPVEIGNEALDPLLQVLLRREAPSP